MAITKEMLQADSDLNTLSEAQITKLTTLSKNDEDTVINTKIGEMHGKYEADIKAVAGVDKNGDEKSYDFLKRVLGDFKAKVDGTTTLQTQMQEAQNTINELKKQISEGKGDETIRKELKDAQGALASLQSQAKIDKDNWEKEKGELTSKMTTKQVNSEFKEASAGLKFKAAYPASVSTTLLNSVKANILATYTPDWIEENGKEVMVFRDKQGEIYRNPANAKNPYTAEELLKEGLKDALEVERKITGSGTGDPKEKQTVSLVDVSSAKTQVEADETISKYLLQNGFIKGSQEFADEQQKIRKENNVQKLPIK